VIVYSRQSAPVYRFFAREAAALVTLARSGDGVTVSLTTKRFGMEVLGEEI
jgi:hypothetical protein